MKILLKILNFTFPLYFICVANR